MKNFIVSLLLIFIGIFAYAENPGIQPQTDVGTYQVQIGIDSDSFEIVNFSIEKEFSLFLYGDELTCRAKFLWDELELQTISNDRQSRLKHKPPLKYPIKNKLAYKIQAPEIKYLNSKKDKRLYLRKC
jgi:hypothetical protein